MALNRHHSKEGGVVVPNAERYWRAGRHHGPEGSPVPGPRAGGRVRVVVGLLWGRWDRALAWVGMAARLCYSQPAPRAARVKEP